MAKEALMKKQEEAFKEAKLPQLLFAQKKIETEMYAVRLTKETADRVREYCRTMNVAQQEFMEESLKFVLEHLKQITAKEIEAAKKRRRKKA